MKKNKLKEGALNTGIQSYQTSSVAPKTSSSSGGKKPTLNVKKNDLTKVMPQLKGDDVNVNVVEEEDVNEVNFLKKAALATSAISGHAQQKTDKSVEFKQNEIINKGFKSFDDVNTWLRQNFDSSTKWDITSISIRDNNNLLNISIDRKKSNTGYNKIVLAVNKEGNPTESRNNVLSKNPNSKEINSGETNFKGISYDWFLIGLKTDDVNYSSGIPKSVSTDNTKPKINQPIQQKIGGGTGGKLIDDKAYKAIYDFETTKGRIDVKTLEPVGFSKSYDVHQRDGIIKDHISKTIGLDVWFKIPPKFRMQIFSYMFNSDADAKDKYRWLAGLAQALDSKQFPDRGAIMNNEDERNKAIEYIKGLSEGDFESHYENYLKVLKSQYGSLSTQNGKAYDDAAKEKSWFVRPSALDASYSQNGLKEVSLKKQKNMTETQDLSSKPKKYQYISDIVDENGELSKPFTINGKNYQMVRALNPKNEKVLGVYSLDEIDEDGNNVIHDVDEFEKTIDDNQMQTETGVQEPERPEANTLNPEGPVAETSDEAKPEHPSFAGHKHFIVNKKTGKARKFKDISELAKAQMTPDEQYMGIKDFKKYVDETLFGAGRKQNLDEVQPTGQESDEEVNVKAKRLMDMIKKKIPQGIVDTIVTPVAQREVIAAFAEMIGVPRNGLSKLIAGLKDLALAKQTPTAQPTTTPTTQATGAVQESRKIIQTIKVKDLNNVNNVNI